MVSLESLTSPYRPSETNGWCRTNVFLTINDWVVSTTSCRVSACFFQRLFKGRDDSLSGIVWLIHLPGRIDTTRLHHHILSSCCWSRRYLGHRICTLASVFLWSFGHGGGFLCRGGKRFMIRCQWKSWVNSSNSLMHQTFGDRGVLWHPFHASHGGWWFQVL